MARLASRALALAALLAVCAVAGAAAAAAHASHPGLVSTSLLSPVDADDAASAAPLLTLSFDPAALAARATAAHAGTGAAAADSTFVIEDAEERGSSRRGTTTTSARAVNAAAWATDSAAAKALTEELALPEARARWARQLRCAPWYTRIAKLTAPAARARACCPQGAGFERATVAYAVRPARATYVLRSISVLKRAPHRHGGAA
jgi:hypothetical protein